MPCVSNSSVSPIAASAADASSQPSSIRIRVHHAQAVSQTASNGAAIGAPASESGDPPLRLGSRSSLRWG
jgi:hypothetical protein